MAWLGRLLGGQSGRRELDALLGGFARQGVTRIACLHCVHFAPWRPTLLGRQREAEIAEADSAGIDHYLSKAAYSDHHRRLTLFYQPHLALAPARNRPEVRAAATGDPIGFGRATEVANMRRAAAMRQVAATGHDLQIGLDPSGFVWAPLLPDDELTSRLARPEVQARDAARFELAVQLAVQTARSETGLPFSAWLFARPPHAVALGNLIAQEVPDESKILMRGGCVGDFSANVGPAPIARDVHRPILVRPLPGGRKWDGPDAEPEWAWGNGWAAAEKLLMWSPSPDSDVDGSGRRADPLAAVRQLLESGVIVDDQLWLTVRSCMSPAAEGARFAGDPHAESAAVLDPLLDAAARAGIAARHVTAGEAYRECIGDRAQPPEGWAISLPKEAGSRSTTVRLMRRDVIGLLAVDEVMSSIRDLGLKESGATEFYQGRAAKGQMLASYEPAIAEVLVALRPRLDHAYEVGSGAAVLTMLLAANGLAATGIDRQPHRIGLAQRILKRIESTGQPLAAPCELKRGRAPQALRRIDGRNAALVFTNMIGSLSDAEETELIKRAADFRVVIVDLARFVRVRDGAGQAALLERFRAACPGDPLLLAGFSSFRVFVRPGLR